MDLSQYYSSICQEPILKKDEETILFEEYNNSETTNGRKEQIRERVIKANLRFAFNQAKKFSRNDPSMFEELISAANEGLIVGFDKFDSTRGFRYLSYAGWWCNQRILREMSKMRVVSLPIWKQQLSSKINKIIDNNEKVTITELYEEFPEISKKDIQEMYRTRYLTYYIDDLNEEEFLIDPIGETVERQMDDNKVWKAVSSLPSPHREVVARCFGLEDDSEHSVSKMSKALKIPKEEIQKIRLEGLAMLKDILGKKEAYLGR